MWSKMNYLFVLALFFFEAVVSVPFPPTYLENNKRSNPSEENRRSVYQNENISTKYDFRTPRAVLNVRTSLPEQRIDIFPNIVREVRVEEIPNHGKHVYIPTANAPIAVPKKHYLQNILSSERIRNVLSSTKHTKRYLVVYPNGRVEHTDSMEAIAKSHPNYILVNAGHIVPSTPKSQVPLVADSVAGVKSPPGLILIEQPATQVSSLHEISAEAIANTEAVPVFQEAIVLSSPAENIEIIKIAPSVEMTPKEENATTIDSSNSSFANSAVTNTNGAIEETVSEQKTAHTESETNASSSQDTITEQYERVIQGKNLVKDTVIIDVNSSGDPVAWFRTSDPNFWNELTQSQDNNIIYFFNVNSRPRIEKDTTRTILPNNTILEEIIETMWYRDDDPVPVVKKSFRIVHPDDLS